MRVYLYDLGIFSEINKKEEITEDTFLLTDREEASLRQIVENTKPGKIWIDSNKQLQWSFQPTPDFYWNQETHEWVLDGERFSIRLEKERIQVWEKIKEVRLQHQSTGVYVDSVNKWFHTDREALTNYNMIGHFINSNAYQSTQWKTMDNTFVEMTAELYQEVMLAIFNKGQHDFKNAEIHRAKLWQFESPLNYDYSTGWSEGFRQEIQINYPDLNNGSVKEERQVTHIESPSVLEVNVMKDVHYPDETNNLNLRRVNVDESVESTGQGVRIGQ